MNAFAVFFASAAVFLAGFRLLGSASAQWPASLRLVLAILLFFAVCHLALWVHCTGWSLLAVALGAAVGSAAIAGEGLQALTDSLGRLRPVVFLLGIITITGLPLVAVPITAFLTSPGELGLHLQYLVSVNSRDAMVAIYVAAICYALAPSSRMKTVLALLATVVATLALVYSFVLPFGFPQMSGLTFEQAPVDAVTRIPRVVLDLALVASVGLGICAWLRRSGARPVMAALLIVNLSVGVSVALTVMRPESGAAGGPDQAARLPAQPLRYSRTQPNVLIVFLDRFMGSYVEGILASDPGIAGRLQGFVWYPRTVSAGQNSIAGVHPMLGGYDYMPLAMNERGRSLRDQSVEAFSILPWNFAQNDYRVNVVSPRGLGFTMAGDCRYLEMERVTCTHIPAGVAARRARELDMPAVELSKANYADLLVLLGAMRSAPYSIKEVIYRRGPWRPFLDHSAGTTFREWAELEALGELSNFESADSNFNFVSNILPHEPYYMGEDCKPRREKFAVSTAEFRRRGHSSLFSLQHEIGARCTLLAVVRYMDVLKQAGVYDNTLVIIVSDHGIVGPVEDRSTRAVAGGTVAREFVRTRSVLLVKEPGAIGDLRISEAFMPNAEVPRIACEQIGGCVNPFLGGIPIETRGRDDPFEVAIVPWQFNLQQPDAFVVQQQLELRGRDPYDASGWVTVR